MNYTMICLFVVESACYCRIKVVLDYFVSQLLLLLFLTHSDIYFYLFNLLVTNLIYLLDG